MDSPSPSHQLEFDDDARPVKKARYDETTRSLTPPSDAEYDDADYLYGKSESPPPQKIPMSSADVPKEDDPLPSNSIPGLDLVRPRLNTAPSPNNQLGGNADNKFQVTQMNEASQRLVAAPEREVHSDKQYSQKPGGGKVSQSPESAQADSTGSVSRALYTESEAVAGYDEFVQAAEANKANQEAEWQFDSSDDEFPSPSASTDTVNSRLLGHPKPSGGLFASERDNKIFSDGSDESDEADDDDAYELLGPEEQARILMAEEGASDGEGGTKGSTTHVQPRTANEKTDEVVLKPNIVITPDMSTPELGVVLFIVENHLLVKATLSGETRVLESGSVLCLEDKTVIGAVAEPLGRVDSPLYSVAFSNAVEIQEFGIEAGTKIFYVEDHSGYVFTQPLKLVKGSDASNLHDEEIADDEREFSDDEAEQEFKRKRKLEKFARKGTAPKESSFSGKPQAGSSALAKSNRTQYPSEPINYDEDDTDGMYNPLPRPSTLLNRPPLPQLQTQRGTSRGSTHRGYGERSQPGPSHQSRQTTRGRAHYHGARGNRGHRGGHVNAVEDRHSHYSQPHDPPPSMPNYDSHGQDPRVASTYDPSHYQGPSQAVQGMPPPPLQNSLWSPNPLSTHHPHPPFTHPPFAHQPNTPFAYIPDQYSIASPSTGVSYGSPISPGSEIPPGAYVNPAFFRNSQWPQSAPPSFQQTPTSQEFPAPNFSSWRQPQEDATQTEHTTTIDEYDPARPWIQR